MQSYMTLILVVVLIAEIIQFADSCRSRRDGDSAGVFARGPGGSSSGGHSTGGRSAARTVPAAVHGNNNNNNGGGNSSCRANKVNSDGV